MRKNKINEVARVAVVSALSIGLFSAAFVGSNNLVFAAATSKTKTLAPPAVTAVNITDEDAFPESYQIAGISSDSRENARRETRRTENEERDSAESSERQSRQVAGMAVLFDDRNIERIQGMLRERENADALSVDKAAELGAQYINDVFEEDITGRTVRLNLSYSGRSSAEGEIVQYTWSGRVTESEQALNDGQYIYDFELDAVSGERISVEIQQKRMTREEEEAFENAGIDEYMPRAYYDAGENNLPEKTITREEMERLPEAMPDINLEPYEQLAQEFAQRHFHNTKVADVTFDDIRVNITGRNVATNDYKYNYTTLSFIASDETGREAEVTLIMETEKLIGIQAVVETRNRTRVPEGYDSMEDYQAFREDAARRRANGEGRSQSSDEFISFGEYDASDEERNVSRNRD